VQTQYALHGNAGCGTAYVRAGGSHGPSARATRRAPAFLIFCNDLMQIKETCGT
jgi:hypothetical protein